MLDIHKNKIKNLVDEDYYLEYLGNLFEYVGRKYGHFVFQDINDVSYSLSVSYEELLNNSKYQLVK